MSLSKPIAHRSKTSIPVAIAAMVLAPLLVVTALETKGDIGTDEYHSPKAVIKDDGVEGELHKTLLCGGSLPETDGLILVH